MKKGYKRLICVLVGLLILLIASVCKADNVLTGNMAKGWTEQKNKDIMVLPVRKGDCVPNTPMILKSQLSGDWYIHANINNNSAPTNGNNLVGIVLFKDANNWLLWGQRNNSSMELSGVIGGTATTVLSVAHKYPHMRIIKRTGDSSYTRYLVYGCDDYTGDDSHEFWQYIGYFEDTTSALNGAQYGLMGWDKATGAQPGGFCAIFDFCDDFVLKNWTDTFYSANLDGAWTFSNPGGDASYSITTPTTPTDNNLILNVKKSDDQWNFVNKAPRILRRAMNQDWIVEGGITSNTAAAGGSSHTGLVVFKDTNNWLMIGQYQNNSVRVEGVIGGVGKQNLGSSSLNKFFRITKNGSSYEFECSNTGYSWTSLYTFSDTGNNLSGAQYGFMGKEWGTGDYTVKFDFFREWPRPTGVIKKIDQITPENQILGEASPNQTETRFNVGSGDLGSMVEMNGTVYQFFGDSFSGNNQAGTWYQGSMARISTSSSYSNGLVYDSMTHNLVTQRNDDFTMIPTFATTDGNGKLYLYIMEVKCWGAPGHWDTNGGAWATSTDNGATWSLQPQMFNGDSSFMQLAITQMPGDSNTLYMLGGGNSGFNNVKLMKVDKAHILDKSYYYFYKGGDGTQPSAWSQNEADAVTVVPAPNREIAVAYDAYLGKYLFTTLDDVNFDMVVREASTPWGTWSDPIILYARQYVNNEKGFDVTGLYGAYMLPRYMDNNGEYVYTTLNEWYTYCPFWYKVHFVKN